MKFKGRTQVVKTKAKFHFGPPAAKNNSSLNFTILVFINSGTLRSIQIVNCQPVNVCVYDENSARQGQTPR